MRALSVKQPWAEQIASGAKIAEWRTWRSPSLIGSDLLIVASKSPGPGYAGEPQGVAICVVHVVRMVGPDPDRFFAWVLSNPRRVAPFAVRGYAALYTVPDASIRYVKPCHGDREYRPRSAKPQRVAIGPYTLSIGDRDLRGERAKTPAAARRRARELAREYGVTITISRDGIAVSGEG